MAGRSVSVKWNDSAIDRMLHSRTGIVGGLVAERAEKVARAARADAPVGVVNGGNLRRQIVVRTEKRGNQIVGIVLANTKYAYFVHEGTGIYAGHGYIRPANSKVMVFSVAYGAYNIPQAGGFYFAERIKGQEAQPFLSRHLPLAVR